MFNKFKKQFAFSVLEVIVAIFVISLGLAGVVSLVLQNIQVQYINRNMLIASQLAQEGLELVRNKRDRNFLAELPFYDGLVPVGSESKIAVDFDGSNINVISVSGIDDNGAKLMINNNFYHHSGTQYSGFNRIVSVKHNAVGDPYISLNCIVQWKDRGRTKQYTAITDLYDWR